MTPRCGREMARYETAGREASPGAPAWCARPQGHPGVCRSGEALHRYAEYLRDRRRARYRAARAAGLSVDVAEQVKHSDRRLALALGRGTA